MSIDTFHNWRTRAACAGSNPDLMHTTKEDEAVQLIHVFCHQCPVMNDCYRDVMTWPAGDRNSGMVAGGRYWRRLTSDYAKVKARKSEGVAA